MISTTELKNDGFHQIIEQIKNAEAEYERLKNENDDLAETMNLSLDDLSASKVGNDMTIEEVKTKANTLSKENEEILLQCERIKLEIIETNEAETKMKEKQKTLLDQFSQLQDTLHLEDANARNQLQNLLEKLKEQHSDIEKQHIKEQCEFYLRSVNLAKKEVPNITNTMKEVVAEECDTIERVIKTIQFDSEANVKALNEFASEYYKSECNELISNLMKQKKLQDIKMKELDMELTQAEFRLLESYKEHQNHFVQHNNHPSVDIDIDESNQLKGIRERCFSLWNELCIDPERIVEFLNLVRKVSSPSEKVYSALCSTAMKLTSKLAIHESLQRIDELLYILSDIKSKANNFLESKNNLLETTLKVNATTKTTDKIKKLDVSIIQTIVKQLRLQYNDVSSDLEQVKNKIQNQIRVFSEKYGEFSHNGSIVTVQSINDFQIVEFDSCLPEGYY